MYLGLELLRVERLQLLSAQLRQQPTVRRAGSSLRIRWRL